MKVRNFLIFFYYFVLIFIFFYTLPININIEKNINIVNMILMFLFFLVWSFSWYLFFVKDILKGSQTEKNRITLVLVLLAIVVFYYNPLPFPNNYYLVLDRIFYFFITIISFISFSFLAYKKNFFTFIFMVFIPIIINSFFVNVLKYTAFFDKYPYFTLCFIGMILIIYYGYNVLTRK